MALEFQAFIDESVSKEEFVLGGYIAPAQTWVELTKDWEPLLPLTVRNKDGIHRFKMSEMALYVDKMVHVPKFHEVIEKHKLIPVSCRMNLDDFASARKRVLHLASGAGWLLEDLGWWENNYYRFVFRAFMDSFHSHRDKLEQIILKRIGFSVVSQLWLLSTAFPPVCRMTVKIQSKLEVVGGFLLMKPGGISPSCACLADWR